MVREELGDIQVNQQLGGNFVGSMVLSYASSPVYLLINLWLIEGSLSI